MLVNTCGVRYHCQPMRLRKRCSIHTHIPRRRRGPRRRGLVRKQDSGGFLTGDPQHYDALGCQTDIAETIADTDGGYLLAVKDNQSDLYDNLRRNFAYLDRSETMEQGHGRTEQRTCTIMGSAKGIRDDLDPDHRWVRLGSAVRMVTERTVRGRTAQSMYSYITNLPVTTGATAGANWVRGHWGIEKNLHGVLDDTFQEDRCRPQHGSPAVFRIELPHHPAAIFWPKC